MSGGADANPDAEPAVHLLDDVGNYLQLCNFSNFQIILFNFVTDDFLQQGYTLYSPPPSFPRTTTPSIPSTPHINSSQVN
jgi:hypothetical protein